jgi:Asp-tRNA(Asn)/Glu-tRNA(Gln) amidotransferase B subunit
VDVLVTGGLDRLWAAVVAAGADPKDAANVLANQFVATGIDPGTVDAGELAKLVAARTDIPRASFDEALAKAGEPGFTADPYLAERVVADTAELDPIIERIIEANSGQAEQYRSGKHGLLGFFVGQVMKETGGSADPRVVNERVRALLG